MKLAKGFDWRAYVRNGKIKDVGFCDCTEKFLEKNEDEAQRIIGILFPSRK